MEGSSEVDWAAVGKAVGWTSEISHNDPTFIRHLLLHLSRYQELQKSQSEAILRSALFEQQSRRFEEEVATNEAKTLTLKTELDNLTASFEKTNIELRQLKNERGQLLAALEEARSMDNRMKSRQSSLENDLSELQRANDRRIAEKAAMEVDHERLLALLSKMRQQGSQVEERFVEAQRSNASLSFELARAQGEIEQLKERHVWSQNELDKVLSEVAEYRKQKSIETAQLNSLLVEKTGEVESLSVRLSASQNAADASAKQLSCTLEELRDVKTEMIKAKADFEAEMDSKVRLVELYKSAAEELNQRISELESALQTSTSKVAELEAHLTRESEASSKNRNVADVFAENSQSRLELTKLRQENDKLKECLEEVCSEIESRAPLLNQERKENERLKRELLSLTNQVVELSRSRDELLSHRSMSREELERLRRENHALEMQSKDLSAQVRSLIQRMEVDVQEVNDSSAFVDAFDEDNPAVFHSVSELQARNAELLKRVHELEFSLSQPSLSADGQQLEAALQEIEQLQEARARQSAMLESLIKQQPTPSSRPSTSSLIDVGLSRELEQLRSEKTRIEQSLNEQIQHLRHETGQLKVQLGRAENQACFATESLELLRKSLENERSELIQLRARQKELMDTNMKLNTQLQSTTAEVISAKEKEHASIMSANQTQSELKALKIAEERMSKELLDTRSDRDRLTRLISQLQATISDHDTGYKEMHERLTQQIDLLEKELTSVRQRLTAELESARSDYMQAEKDRRDLLVKQEQLLDELTRTKSDLIRLQAEGPSSNINVHETFDQSVEHYKAVAQASEQALEQLGMAFEQYREEVETTGSSQYERLYKELEASKAEIADQKQMFEAEIMEYKSRLAVLEHAEEQLREHGSMRLEDVARLQKMLEETCNELSVERAHSEDLQDALNNLNASIESHLQAESDLKQVIAELEGRNSILMEEKNNLQQQQINVQSKFDDLNKQYNSLLEKLEGTLNPQSSFFFEPNHSGEDEQVKQVIRYLRREKDGLEREKNALEAENRRLTLLYDQTSTSYDQLKKSLLSSTTSPDQTLVASKSITNELQTMKAKLEQLNGVRESAAMLQAQVESLNERVLSTESELNASKDQLQSLKEVDRELRISVATQQHEIKLATEDRDLWKQRCEQLSRKSLNEAQSEALMEVKADYERVVQEKEQITDEANQKLANLEARCNKLLERFNHYKKRCEELQHKVSELEASLAASKSSPQSPPQSSDQVEVIAGELEETRGLLNEALAQKDDLTAQLQSSEQKISRLTSLIQKYKTIRKEECEKMKAEFNASLSEAKEELKNMETRLKDAQQEHSLHQTALSSQWKGRLEKLQKTIEEYKQRFGEIHAASEIENGGKSVNYFAKDKEDHEATHQQNNKAQTEESYNEDEEFEDEEEYEEEYDDDDDDDDEPATDEIEDMEMMTDDDIMPVIPAPISAPISAKPAMTTPPKTSLMTNIKAMSPIDEDGNIKPRPRFVDLSGIRSSTAPLTPQSFTSIAATTNTAPATITSGGGGHQIPKKRGKGRARHIGRRKIQ